MEFLWTIFPKKACCKLVSNIWRRQSHTAQAYRNCLKIMLKYCSFKRCSPILISYDKLAYFRKIIAVVVSKIDPLRLKSCQIMASFGSAKGLWISWCLLGCAKVLSDAPLDSREAGARLIKMDLVQLQGPNTPPSPARRGVNDPMMDGNW